MNRSDFPHVFVAVLFSMAVAAGANDAAAPASAPGAAGGDPSFSGITVKIIDLRSDSGRMGCQIFNSAQGYPKDTGQAFRKHWCKIENRSSTCRFDSIPVGTYAAACFHDENLNGKLDEGLLGIPKEGVAVSNYGKGLKGPPRFKKSRFKFTGKPMVLLFRLTYRKHEEEK